MKNLIPLVLAVLLIGAGCIFNQPDSVPVPQTSSEQAEFVSFIGVLSSVDADTNAGVVQMSDGSTEQVRFEEVGTMRAEDVGNVFRIEGNRDPSTRVISLTEFFPIEGQNLIVVLPEAGATVTSPLIVNGFGRVFEQQFAWRVRDSAGTVVASGSAMTHAPDAGQFGPFSFDVFLPALNNVNFTFEALTYSAKDGSEQDLVSVPLKLLSLGTTSVKAYFSNGRMGSGFDCEQVFPVERTIAQTSAVGRAAIAELLKGPTEAERAEGYRSQISEYASLNSLVIGDRVAKADFSSDLTSGGSCRVQAIRSQIENTLLQFDTVDTVTISVNGDSETALQP